MQTTQQASAGDVVELWTAAHHRLGLTPSVRRVWCRRGQRPQVVVQHRDQWGSLYAFVPPASGRSVWWRLPTVSVAAFTVALGECAQTVGAGHGQQMMLVRDGAGWHVSPQVQVPTGVHWHVLPPSSPELPPAECRWPLTNEALAHRHLRDLDAREAVQAQRGLPVQARPEVIRTHTTCHWWPQTA